MSPSRIFPIGPPARPSGPMWPMHAPVETPEKRASVSSATCLPMRQMFQRAGDLVGFLHARAHRADAGQHQHVAGLDSSFFDRGHRVFFIHKNPRRSFLLINSVRIQQLTDQSPWLSPPNLPAQDCRAEKPACSSRPRARACSGEKITSSASTPSSSLQQFAEPRAALGFFPPIQIFAQRFSGDGEHIGVEQIQVVANAASLPARRPRETRARSDDEPGRSAKH